MSDAKPLRLLADARSDLGDIWLYSADMWGQAQADRYTTALERSFKTIASMPGIGREYPEFNPPVRILPSAEHLIVYFDLEEEVLVIRVLGSRQDWREILNV